MLMNILFGVDPAPGAAQITSLETRLLYVVCGIIGAAMAVAVDPPTNKRQAFGHILVGGGCTFLFGEYITELVGIKTPAGFFFTMGLIGVLSWFLLTGIVEAGKRLKDGSLIRQLLLRFLLKEVPVQNPGTSISSPTLPVQNIPPLPLTLPTPLVPPADDQEIKP